MLNSTTGLHTGTHCHPKPFRDISNTTRANAAAHDRVTVILKAFSSHVNHSKTQSAVGSSSQPTTQSARDASSSEGFDTQQGQQPPKGTFRFWYDERRFKGQADRSIVQQALFEAGGVRTGGYPKAAPVAGPLGSDRMDDWDILWSPGRSALDAAPKLRTGQLLPCVPGLSSITKKAKLVTTLKAAYGEEAFGIIPRSYVLPADVNDWGLSLADNEEAARQLWILKTGQHLGKGLRLLPGVEALNTALSRRAPNSKPFVVAQKYISNPLLINGCKWGIRVWALVASVKPFRVYLHQNGLVLFSTQRYDSSSWEGGGGSVAEGHVTNYACNVNGAVWDLDMLRNHLGPQQFQQLWSNLVSCTARTFCAALPSVQETTAKLNLKGNCTFEVIGLDYLVDTDMQPWLLEANATPSLAVEHCNQQVEDIIRKQKTGMVKDMLNLLDIRNRFKVRYLKKGAPITAEDRLWRYQTVYGTSPDGNFLPFVEQELERRGGWLPLMLHFPRPSGHRRFGLTAEDMQLHKWLEERVIEGMELMVN